MRVALDATALTLSSGGLRRYVSELSRALAACFPEDEFLLMSDQPFRMPEHCPKNLRAAEGPRNALERRWWSWGVRQAMRRSAAQVFHGTNFEVPYLPVTPSVMTLHDLSPWMDRAWHGEAGRVRRRVPVLLRLGLATLVLTHSESVRRQAIARFGLDPERVVAAPLAAASHFQPANGAPAARPYFLFVGTLEPRKNLGLLLEAWREVRKRHAVDLVLAGRCRSDYSPPPEEDGLRRLGEVSEQELPELYTRALACVYPSLYEGFGLPVLEAMQCGAPVIASRDPAIAEVAGDAAILLDARDVRAWIEALTVAAAHPERLAPWRERGLRRARQFSWERTARLTREAYEEARRRFGR